MRERAKNIPVWLKILMIFGDAYANRLAAYKAEATDEKGRINKDLVTEEMIAEVTARVLTLDETFMKNLANEDRGFVQKVSLNNQHLRRLKRRIFGIFCHASLKGD